MRDCGAVIMEPSAREFTVNVVETSGFGEPVFFPKLLNDAFARFRSWRRCGALGYLCKLGVFEPCGDGGEYAVHCRLYLVFLGFDFEFYVADFHFYFDGRFLRVFCQLLHLLFIVLYKMYMRNTYIFHQQLIEYW